MVVACTMLLILLSVAVVFLWDQAREIRYWKEQADDYCRRYDRAVQDLAKWEKEHNAAQHADFKRYEDLESRFMRTQGCLERVRAILNNEHSAMNCSNDLEGT